MPQGEDWDTAVRKKPSAIAVATLANSDGYRVCCERWSWLSPRTIGSLIRQGRKQIAQRNGS